MIWGFQKSTDMRNSTVEIKKFTSEEKAKKWKEGGGFFTHSNPEEARNHHHTFRYIFKMPKGWRPDIKRAKFNVSRTMGSIYYSSINKEVYHQAHEEGEEL